MDRKHLYNKKSNPHLEFMSRARWNVQKMLGLGPKGESFNTYTSPQSSEQMDRLKGVVNYGLGPGYASEMQNLAKQNWMEETVPQLREDYETKRNPYGGAWSDSPEFKMGFDSQRNALRDVNSIIAQQNASARTGALQQLSQLVGGPITQYQQATDPMKDLLTGGLGLLGSLGGNYFGGKMTGQALKDVWGMGGAVGAGDMYKDFYDTTKNKEYQQATAQPDLGQSTQMVSSLLPLLMGMI